MASTKIPVIKIMALDSLIQVDDDGVEKEVIGYEIKNSIGKPTELILKVRCKLQKAEILLNELTTN